MNVEIGEVSSTVRSVDGDTLLSPRVLERLVHAIAERLKDQALSDKRAKAERRITGGVEQEREQEEH